jgi:hypothetical protein
VAHTDGCFQLHPEDGRAKITFLNERFLGTHNAWRKTLFGRKADALAVLADRRDLYVLRGRRALLTALLATGQATADAVRDVPDLPDAIDPVCLGAVPLTLLRTGIICETRGLDQAVADRLSKTRDEAKARIMVVFFDKPWHCNAVSAVLDELFPTVMQAMRRIKGQDYRRLADFAQRIESAFMFRQVVPRIMERHPDLFVATIHDSILTTAGDAQFVRQVMCDEFAQLGLSPQVKLEPCCGTPCKGKTKCWQSHSPSRQAGWGLYWWWAISLAINLVHHPGELDGVRTTWLYDEVAGCFPVDQLAVTSPLSPPVTPAARRRAA